MVRCWSVSATLHVIASALCCCFIGSPPANEECVIVVPPRKWRPVPGMERPVPPDWNRLDLVPSPELFPALTEEERPRFDETDDEEEFQKAKGSSFDFIDRSWNGLGFHEKIGCSADGAGGAGCRLGGKRKLASPGAGTVLAALTWLARHQNDNGSWGVRSCIDLCNGQCSPNPGEADFDAGVTGLAVLAFLGAGYSHRSDDTHDGICYGSVVRRGLRWITSQQDPEGCIGPRFVSKYMYNHLVCALALCEAFNLTGSNLARASAQRAIDFAVAAQNPGKGWRYSFKCGDNDSSVTGWAVRLLASAEQARLEFPRSSYDGARAWFESVTDSASFRVGYTMTGG